MHDPIKPTNGQQSSRWIPSELWRALLDIYNYYHFSEELANDPFLPPEARPPRQLLEAVHLLNVWLDVALNEGWLDEDVFEQTVVTD